MCVRVLCNYAGTDVDNYDIDNNCDTDDDDERDVCVLCNWVSGGADARVGTAGQRAESGSLMDFHHHHHHYHHHHHHHHHHYQVPVRPAPCLPHQLAPATDFLPPLRTER